MTLAHSFAHYLVILYIPSYSIVVVSYFLHSLVFVSLNAFHPFLYFNPPPPPFRLKPSFRSLCLSRFSFFALRAKLSFCKYTEREVFSCLPATGLSLSLSAPLYSRTTTDANVSMIERKASRLSSVRLKIRGKKLLFSSERERLSQVY